MLHENFANLEEYSGRHKLEPFSANFSITPKQNILQILFFTSLQDLIRQKPSQTTVPLIFEHWMMCCMTPLLETLSIVSFRIRLNNYIQLQVGKLRGKNMRPQHHHAEVIQTRVFLSFRTSSSRWGNCAGKTCDDSTTMRK